MIGAIVLFWALCVVYVVNMVRYFSSLDEFIRCCQRVRGQFMLTSSLCGLVMSGLIGLAIWH